MNDAHILPRRPGDIHVWVENGDRWHYRCSLCSRIFGPFTRERNAVEFGDLHASECADA